MVQQNGCWVLHLWLAHWCLIQWEEEHPPDPTDFRIALLKLHSQTLKLKSMPVYWLEQLRVHCWLKVYVTFPTPCPVLLVITCRKRPALLLIGNSPSCACLAYRNLGNIQKVSDSVLRFLNNSASWPHRVLGITSELGDVVTLTEFLSLRSFLTICHLSKKAFHCSLFCIIGF